MAIENKPLSPSNLNIYIKDKAAWVMRYFYSLYSKGNIYAIRGILAEHQINNRFTSFEKYAKSAICKVLFSGVVFSEKELKSFYDWGLLCQKLIPEKQVSQQKELKGTIKGVLMRGFIDYEYENYCIDLKTTNKLPIICSRGVRKGLIEAKKRDNVRQQIIYRILSGKPQRLLYVDQSGTSLEYKIGYRDYREHLPEIYSTLKEIKKFLTMKKEDVILEIRPEKKNMNNPYSFHWDTNLIKEAKEIWQYLHMT